MTPARQNPAEPVGRGRGPGDARSPRPPAAARLRVEVVDRGVLRFDDGLPVRAASGITAFEDGWLVVSDDATHAAVWGSRGITPVRVLPPVDGHDTFSDAAGTKQVKPDLEAACRVPLGPDRSGALLLGSGSLPARMRVVLLEDGSRDPTAANLSPLYRRVATALDLPPEHLNLEGACVVGDVLRWFQRGNDHLGVPSVSIDVGTSALVSAVRGELPSDAVPVAAQRRYELDAVGVAGLAVTDAVALPDGLVLVSAAAEDTPNAVEDGPVADSALVLLDGERAVAGVRLPHGPDGPDKVEGLALAGVAGSVVQLVAVVDDDDPSTPSRVLRLALTRG